MSATIHVLRRIAAETPEQINAARAAFYQERIMREIPIRTPQQERIAAMLATVNLTPEAPMITNAPEPISKPGFGHALMVPILFFAIIGAAMTGIWLMKAAMNVARAMGWV